MTPTAEPTAHADGRDWDVVITLPDTGNTLSRAEARRLGEDLLHAADTEPAYCARTTCDRFAVDDGLCTEHAG